MEELREMFRRESMYGNFKIKLKDLNIPDGNDKDTIRRYWEIFKDGLVSKTELDYYKDVCFVDAWFVDNVGSFLIVIERKKR